MDYQGSFNTYIHTSIHISQLSTVLFPSEHSRCRKQATQTDFLFFFRLSLRHCSCVSQRLCFSFNFTIDDDMFGEKDFLGCGCQIFALG